MNTDIDQKDDTAWQRYVKAYRELVETGHSSDWNASVEGFLAEAVNRIPFLQRLNTGKHWERLAALYILPKIAADELQIIFREIVYLAAYTISKASFIRSVIYSMPRDWVVANIEKFAEEHLVPSKTTGTDSEYRRLLELYVNLDPELTIRLATRAIQNADPEIKEAGEEFLDYYKDSSNAPENNKSERRSTFTHVSNLMMEIIPNKGVGPIRFGMTPREVKVFMGKTLVYEDWMGGNLNDALYYSGIVLCFDKFHGSGPLENGRLIEIWINEPFNSIYKGVPLSSLNQEAVEQLLKSEGITYITRGDKERSGIYVKPYQWELCFKNTKLFHIRLFPAKQINEG